MEINTSVTLGEILQVAGFVVGGLTFALTLRSNLRNVILDVSDLKSEVKKLGDILTRLAVQDQRMSSMDRRIEELARGEGMILPMGRSLYEKSS